MKERSPLFAPLDSFRTPDAPRLLTRSTSGAALALTEVWGPANHGLTAAIPQSRNYLVQLRLRDCEGATYFQNGKVLSTSDHRAGAIQFHDLRQEPTVELRDPFHVMHVNLPLAALESIGQELGMARLDELMTRPGQCHRDPIIEYLLRAMRPALARPNEVSALFLEQVSTAICVHLLQHYASAPELRRQLKGGLSPWQLRLAREMLNTDLQRDLTLTELAHACGVSVRHITRAFKQSTGMSAHQYRLKNRLDQATLLLRTPTLPISEIALLCGFASQSHLTRCFRRYTGQTPAVWRAMHAKA